MDRVGWILLALCLALSLVPLSALADPPPPKVCVVVVGDPDEAARAAAETLTEAISTRDDLRGVADADTRATLRGEPRASGSEELAATRRALRGEDRDATALDSLAQNLGCAVVVEVASRPTGTMLRPYDSVHHGWLAAHEVSSVEPALVERVIVPAARAAMARTANTAGGGASTSASAGRSPVRAQARERPSTLQRLWPYLVAGGAAAVLAVVFLVASDTEPTQTQLTVVHGGR